MPDATPTVLAAIDIGSSAIRMDIAEIGAGGSLHLLESLKKGVQLGRDTFTEGALSEESIRAACQVLRDFKRVMDTYAVGRYRAVATSAVREALNCDTFLDRVMMSTGLDVDVIDVPEENRLMYAAVLESLRGGPDLGQDQVLLVEVGGGSSDVTLLSGGEPLQSDSFPIGSIRLASGATRAPASQEQQTRVLRRQIGNLLSNVRRLINLKDARHFVALGGDVRIAARLMKLPRQENGLYIAARDSFGAFVDSVARLTADALVQKYNLSYLDAESLGPALMCYLQLCKETQAQQVIVSNATIREGILQDLAPAEQSDRIHTLTHQILSAARNLGRKYQYDEAHAERVRELAELIFDELKTEQRLSDTHRLYLQVAALLHDIGLFVSSRGHHKHSQYLIASSALFGLRQRELNIISNVARYHRRALPQRAHTAFVSLDREERMIVSKLGAILRIANALDKEHLQKLTGLKVSREGDQLVLTARNVQDLTLERAALEGRSNFFAEVFGKRIVLREGPTTL